MSNIKQHVKDLAEKIDALSKEEIHELLSELKQRGTVTAQGCARGYIPDGHGGCVLDPLN